MTSEEHETLEEISGVLTGLSRSLAYLELAVRDLVDGKPVQAQTSIDRGRPTLTIVRADA